MPRAAANGTPTVVSCITVTGSAGGFTHTAAAVIDGEPTTIIERRESPEVDWSMLDDAVAHGRPPIRAPAPPPCVRGARAIGCARPRERRSPRTTRAGPSGDGSGSGSDESPPDPTADAACPSFELRLKAADLKPGENRFDDTIWWTWHLHDDRLPWGETFLFVATERCGRAPEMWHSTDSGVNWDELGEMDGRGMPIDDPELLEQLGVAIEDELRRVDLARLLIHSPRPARRRRGVARRAA